MIRLMIAAPASGHGKTVVTCAILTALQNRGLNPCAFKCGPDFIDPMFHRAVLGAESHNLDLFLSDAQQVQILFARASCNHGAAVCEGAMGFYDGLGGVTDCASAWHTAEILNFPVLLVIRAKGAALSLAAVVKGLRDFRKNSHIAAILLNDCSPVLFQTLAPVLEWETGLPVSGCLPHVPEAEIASRHLGLRTAAEIHDLQKRFSRLAETLEANTDMEHLLNLFDVPDGIPESKPFARCPDCKTPGIRIAVAHDAAFCFTYAETLETLEKYGAEPIFFSPLHDVTLPDNIGGLYLPGGYPELHAQTLSENLSMRKAVAAAVRDGMPTVAECGGFLYLGKSLQTAEGNTFPMVGVLPGEGFPCGKLIRFGYAAMSAEKNSLLFHAGETVPVHEFHHWDSTDNGNAFLMEKPVSGRRWQCGFANDTLYAAFPHLYFQGCPETAERFIHAARRYILKKYNV